MSEREISQLRSRMETVAYGMLDADRRGLLRRELESGAWDVRLQTLYLGGRGAIAALAGPQVFDTELRALVEKWCSGVTAPHTLATEQPDEPASATRGDGNLLHAVKCAYIAYKKTYGASPTTRVLFENLKLLDETGMVVDVDDVLDTVTYTLGNGDEATVGYGHFKNVVTKAKSKIGA